MAVNERVKAVASLTFKSPGRRDKGKPYHIYPNDEFDIGRTAVLDYLGLRDASISTHHLRFHCVIYDETIKEQVMPMVYVRNLSRRSVTLSRRDGTSTGEQRNISRQSGDLLLRDGDAMCISRKVLLLFNMDAIHGVQTLEHHTFEQQVPTQVSKHYTITNHMLGFGAFAKVFLAERKHDKKQLACKVIQIRHKQNGNKSLKHYNKAQKPGLHSTHDPQDIISREFNILQTLTHPNIISLDKVFCTPQRIFIFQELFTRGDLLSYVERVGNLNEPQTVIIIKQVLEAVHYLHANRVVHRDIKPENILMTSWRDGARILLTDFGQSRVIPEDSACSGKGGQVSRMKTLVGTPGYTAPEVYKHANRGNRATPGYSKAIDIWSVGCVAAVLLNSAFVPSGSSPASHTDLNQNPQPNAKPFEHQDWPNISPNAKSFLTACLSVNESQRPTAVQALQHPWFQHDSYAAALEAAYQRAIAHWTPFEHAENLIEYIDDSPTKLPLFETHDVHQDQQAQQQTATKSPHFTTPPPFSVPNFTALTLRRAHTPLPTIADEEHSLPLPQYTQSASLGSFPLPRTQYKK